MSDLHIPEAAQEEYFTCGCHDPRCTRVGYQPEALPLVVAAELRRLAKQERPGDPEDLEDEAEQAYGEGRNEVCANMLGRADELDGGEPS